MSAIRYIIEVTVCSGLFLVFYRWMIARKVSFRICRIYLMTAMLLSAAIPAMNVPVYTSTPIFSEVLEGDALTKLTQKFEVAYETEETAQTVNGQQGTATENIVSEATAKNIATREEAKTTAAAIKVTIGSTTKSTAEGKATSANSIVSAATAKNTATVAEGKTATAKEDTAKGVLAVIYMIAAAAGLSLIIYNAARIGRIRRRSQLTHTKEYTLAEYEEIKTPFSFLRTIFMGFNYEPQERRQILTHEASHVRHRHSYERLVLSVLRAIYWFNPFFWMAEKDLEDVQEWEADKDVLDEGWNLNTYRTTIFKQLFGYNPDISCGLNHSLTKQRFIMMTQSHRGKGAWIRLAATLPIIAAVFFAFGCGVRDSRSQMTEDKAATDLTDTTAIKLSMPCHPIRLMNGYGGKEVKSAFSRKHTGIDYALNDGDPIFAVADGYLVSIVYGDKAVATHDQTTNITEFHYPENAHFSAEKSAQTGHFMVENVKVDLNRNDGTVEFRCPPDSPGLTVRIRHENGIESVYRQVPHITLRPDRIEAGQIIGKAGMTARSTGVHLHFEIHKEGEAVDPAPYLNNAPLPEKYIRINIVKAGESDNRIQDTYHREIDGQRYDLDGIAKVIEEKMAKDSTISLVEICADAQTPMGYIRDIKQKLQGIKNLRLKYNMQGVTATPPPAAKTTEEQDKKHKMTVIHFNTDLNNIIHLKINAADRYLVGDRPDYLDSETLERLKGYILNPENDRNRPSKTDTEIILPDGTSFTYPVPQGMIVLDYDRGTSYEGFMEAEEFVRKAYDELWNELAMEKLGRPYSGLSDAEKKAIRTAIPMNVCEFRAREVKYPLQGWMK